MKNAPYRVGTTSYIVPDHVVPNVRFLAGRVDDVEIVLFETGEDSNLPGPAEIETLQALAGEHGLTYTIHLPLTIHLGAADPAIRAASVAQCLRVVRLTAPLTPFAYITHFHHDHRDRVPPEDRARWVAALGESVRELTGGGVAPRDLCVETLAYPFELVEDVVFGLGLSVCFDVGHILDNGYSLPAYFERYYARTRVLHVHGIRDGRDHASLAHLDADSRALLRERLRENGGPPRVITLEVFNRDDFESSLGALREILS